LLLLQFPTTLATLVAAQGYPNKPVTMIVAFPPGGGSDVLGRLVGKGMQESLGQTVVVENIMGVGGSLGVHLMAEKALQNSGATGLHAPYNGLEPYLKDLMADVIDFAVVPLVSPVLGAIECGQIKALAVAAPLFIAPCPSCRLRA
jgi:tripartite-type tricarboxylate transporter receptor subunit TctC